MSAAPGAVAAIALICGGGAALSGWLRSERNDGFLVGLGWSYLYGTMLVALVLHVPLVLYDCLSPAAFAVSAGVCLLSALGFLAYCVGCWWSVCSAGFSPWLLACTERAKARTTNGYEARTTGGRTWRRLMQPQTTGLIVVGVVLLAAFGHTLRSDFRAYDARAIYALKARILYDGAKLHGEDFCDELRLNFHPTYPLLVPLAEAQVFWVQGGYESPGARCLFAAFVAALVLVFLGEVRRHESQGWAAAWTVLLLLTPMVSGAAEGAGLSGSVDLPLACFLLAAQVEIGRWLDRPGWKPALSAGLMLGAAVLTKQEGILWVAVCGLGLAALAATRRLRLERRHVFTGMAAAAMLAAAVLLHKAAHWGMHESAYYRPYLAAMDPQWLSQLAGRPAAVLGHTLKEILLRGWNLVWLPIVASLFLVRRGPLLPRVWFWRASALLACAAYAAIFAITPLQTDFHLVTTFARLALHYFPLAMLVMAEQLAAAGWTEEISTLWRRGRAGGDAEQAPVPAPHWLKPHCLKPDCLKPDCLKPPCDKPSPLPLRERGRG